MWPKITFKTVQEFPTDSLDFTKKVICVMMHVAEIKLPVCTHVHRRCGIYLVCSRSIITEPAVPVRRSRVEKSEQILVCSRSIIIEPTVPVWRSWGEKSEQIQCVVDLSSQSQLYQYGVLEWKRNKFMSLAGGAESIIFVATNKNTKKRIFCRDKKADKTWADIIFSHHKSFVATNLLMSRQTYFCRDKHKNIIQKTCFVATKDVFCSKKNIFCCDKNNTYGSSRQWQI